jgi:hypothetical protein
MGHDLYDQQDAIDPVSRVRQSFSVTVTTKFYDTMLMTRTTFEAVVPTESRPDSPSQVEFEVVDFDWVRWNTTRLSLTVSPTFYVSD